MALTKTIQQAARALGRSRGLAILAVITLGLGIGSTTFMFSLVHGALYRGLPFPDGDEIMVAYATHAGEGIDRGSWEWQDYRELRGATSFEEVAAYYSGTVNLATGERAVRFDGAFLTANAFDLLRVQPLMGRTFLPGDDVPGAESVVVLSYGAWRDEFGADPAVLGRPVRVNGEPATVVGVMREGFMFPEYQDVWVAMRRSDAEARGVGADVRPFGRLADGASRESAQAEISAIADRIAAEHPEDFDGWGVNVTAFTDMGSETAAVLFTMLAAVGLILLVACINVANLLLARTATRSREIAVRTALGAGRGRLIGQLVAEAGVLAAAGAVLGAGLAWLGMEWFNEAIRFTQPPFWFVFAIDAPILAFTAGVAALAAVVSGVVPGIKATGGDIQEILKDDSRGSSSMRLGRLSRALVVGEIALSMGLLVVAGLMTKGIIERRNLDLPFPTENVFAARVALFEAEYPDAESRRAVYDEVLRTLGADPAIEAVTLSSSLPGTGSPYDRVELQGHAYAEAADRPRVRTSLVSPGFFRTFEAEPVRGRLIDERDAADALPVAVINESLAADLFPGDDPVGRQIRLAPIRDTERPWRTIVGVVPDLAMDGPRADPTAVRRGLYVPLAQDDATFISIAARPRGAGDPMALTPTVREAVGRAAPDTPLYWVQTLQETIDENLWAVDVFGAIMIAFGIIALVMAVAGLYGVTAFTVGRRTHEVGIRMAMGADAGRVVRMIMRQGAVQIAIGLAIGLALAVVLAAGMREILFRVDPRDPLVYGAITAILTITALAASAIPALRASRVDPARALRRD